MRLAWTVLLSTVVLAGCAGAPRGHVELIALDYRNIDPPAPKVWRIHTPGCYWWSDEAGQVWIALERDQPSPLGRRARHVFRLSLVLPELPAGRAREYHVSRRALRAFERFGPAERRLSAIVGVVALYREANERLRGTVRFQVQQEVLVGLAWNLPTRQLMLGEFTAVWNPERGQAIVAETEADGWERPPEDPQPTTRTAPSAW